MTPHFQEGAVSIYSPGNMSSTWYLRINEARSPGNLGASHVETTIIACGGNADAEGTLFIAKNIRACGKGARPAEYQSVIKPSKGALLSLVITARDLRQACM